MKSWIKSSMLAAAVIVVLTSCTQNTGEQQSSSGSSALVSKLDTSNFDQEIASGVVLVDFWATWCPPCRTQGPIVDKVAGQVEGKAKVAKLDVDAAPKIAQRYNIRSIPTLVVFKDGKPAKQFVGLTQAEPLVAAITGALNSN